jgi:hypothetical protein
MSAAPTIDETATNASLMREDNMYEHLLPSVPGA